MANSLAQADVLGTYFTGGEWSGAELTRISDHIPLKGIRAAVNRELERRRLPDSVRATRLVLPAALDAIAVLTLRLRIANRARVPLLRMRNELFDRTVRDRLDRKTDIFIGAFTACLHSLMRANRLGIRSFLDYPIAHHRYSEAILRQEAFLTPEYAPTLQFHQFPIQLRARMEKEIDLADKIFMLSDFQRQTFLEAGVDDRKLVMTPLGVDSELFRPLRFAKNGARFRVLFVGQITQRKGLSYLIRGFHQAAIPNSELLLVGTPSGTRRPWINEPLVKHMGHVSRKELPLVYALGDVFVLPSLVEGFPQTAMEAMACGLPTIVSNNTFGRQVIIDGTDGYVVPIRDPDAIADRLRYLWQDESLRQRMGKCARQKAKYYSWQEYCRRVKAAIGVPDGSGIASMRTDFGPRGKPF